MATKIYSNTTGEDMTVLGIGIIPAGENVSLTSDYLPPIILANYPGLEDITDIGNTDEETVTTTTTVTMEDQNV